MPLAAEAARLRTSKPVSHSDRNVRLLLGRFTGAFQALKGSARETEWRFEKAAMLSAINILRERPACVRGDATSLCLSQVITGM